MSVCRCIAYAWPHRRTSGQCLWNPNISEPRCRECGRPCEIEVGKLDPEERIPFGLPEGLEYCQSKCCGADVIADGQILEAGDV